jgi:hypothetical protein
MVMVMREPECMAKLMHERDKPKAPTRRPTDVHPV